MSFLKQPVISNLLRLGPCIGHPKHSQVQAFNNDVARLDEHREVHFFGACNIQEPLVDEGAIDRAP